jgi:hypothetical protein
VTQDNNNDKAVGFRLQGKIHTVLGLGLSFYEDRYTNQSDPDRRLFLLGVDFNWAVAKETTVAGGYLFGYVGLLPGSGQDSFERGGIYLNVTQTVAPGWKIRPSLGQTHFDSRVDSISDQSLIGADLIRDLGWLQFYLQIYHDLNSVAGKKGYDYYGLRGVLMR